MLHHAEDIAAIHALTAADLRKLRTADTISFHRSPDSSGIKASKDKHAPTGHTTLWEHEIPAHSTIKACYGSFQPPEGKPLPEVAYCHYYLSHADNIHEPWRTIAGLLKKGDRLEMEWTRDAHTNGYSEKARLHADRLRLIIHRGTGTRKKAMLFIITIQICEDNTARLICRGVYNTE